MILIIYLFLQINSSPPVSGGCEPPPPSLPYQPHHDVAFGTSMSLNIQHPSDSSQQLSELASLPCINTPTVSVNSVRSPEAVTSQGGAAPVDTRPANDADIQDRTAPADTRPASDVVIQGVPFRLCPALELTVTAHTAGINAGTFHTASPVSRYQYDFSVERSVLDNQHLSYW